MADRNSSGKMLPTAAVTAGVICLLVYLGTLGSDFVYIDDPSYVYNNGEIRTLDLQLLKSAFTGLFAGDYWMPLTWLSFAVDYHFWGLNPAGYHLTNSLLHAVNAALVVLLAGQVVRVARGGACSNLSHGILLLSAGLLWGLHPMRVESVAWVSERKDVLNGLFSFAALLCYVRYALNRAEGFRRAAARWYLLSLGCFICSLMAKPASVILPVVLLVLDWYPLQRAGREPLVRLLPDKLPFLLFSAAVTSITILAKMQYAGLQPLTALPFSVRTVISGNAVFEYLRMTLWPVGIVPYNPIPKPLPLLFIAKATLVGGTTAALIVFGRRSPRIAAPCSCFLLLLLPVLSFMHTGFDIALAPRFTYLASIVPVIALTVFLCEDNPGQDETLRWRTLALVPVAVMIFCCAVATVRLNRSWRDTETLWTRQIEIMPLGRAYNARGHYYLIRDRYDEAIADFSTALSMAVNTGQPFVDNILAFRGEALRLAGRHEEAAADLRKAVALNPHPRYCYHLGLTLEALGMTDEAATYFTMAGTENGPIIWLYGT